MKGLKIGLTVFLVLILLGCTAITGISFEEGLKKIERTRFKYNVKENELMPFNEKNLNDFKNDLIGLSKEFKGNGIFLSSGAKALIEVNDSLIELINSVIDLKNARKKIEALPPIIECNDSGLNEIVLILENSMEKAKKAELKASNVKNSFPKEFEKAKKLINNLIDTSNHVLITSENLKKLLQENCVK
jgi:hypothetical protein